VLDTADEVELDVADELRDDASEVLDTADEVVTAGTELAVVEAEGVGVVPYPGSPGW